MSGNKLPCLGGDAWTWICTDAAKFALEPYMSAATQWEQLLTPAVMHERLISASLYVTAYELLRESVIGRLRSFYMAGFDTDGEIIDERYETAVLSRNKSSLYASLGWLIENEVIDQTDVERFERLKSTRNSLAHELPSLVLNGTDFQVIERFQELVELLRKIEVWWVVNVEIPTDPVFDGREIDEEGVVPGPVLLIQMMLEVLSGNEELLTHYKNNSRGANTRP
jgi:hypothetical protein